MIRTNANPADAHRLEGKVVLVTGSTRGIGRAIAEQIARNGGAFIPMSSMSASMGMARVVNRGTIFNSLG